MTELPEAWVESVSARAAPALIEHYRGLGYLVDELDPPEPYVPLYIRRSARQYRYPLRGEPGFDISHYQGAQTAAGFQAARDAGFTWCGIKLGENAYLDDYALANIKICQELMFPYLLYIEWRYDTAPLPQAIWVTTMLHAISENPPLGLMVALEENYSVVNGVRQLVDPRPYAASMPANARVTFDRLRGDNSSLRVGCYSRRSFIAAWFAGAAWLRDVDLWNAFFTLNRPVLGTTVQRLHPFWLEADGVTPAQSVLAWQYYAPGTGLYYSQVVPGIGDVDQSWWLEGPRG